MNQFRIYKVVIYLVGFKVCSPVGLLLCILNRTMTFIEYRIKFKRTTKEGETIFKILLAVSLLK